MCRLYFAKGGVLGRLLLIVLLLSSTRVLHAQRITSYGVSAGAAFQDDARPTAAFALAVGVHWFIPWTTSLQGSGAELDIEGAEGTLRDISFAALPSWEPLQGRLLFAAGPALHSLHRNVVFADDESELRVSATGMLGARFPIAGEGVVIELLARADALEPEPQYSAFFGVRVRPGRRHTLTLGEPMSPTRIAAHRAVWNDVLMQLILLQQNLESFTRIREIETGIELEFDQTQVTLYDDIARVARVLAAAEPPVMATVFAPNAGRAGAAVTAGSFPAERLRLQRDTRVYLRVEH